MTQATINGVEIPTWSQIEEVVKKKAQNVKTTTVRLSTESAIELQKQDCNCNDCAFLLRNNYKKQIQDAIHASWQFTEWQKNRNDQLGIAYIMRDQTILNKTLKEVFKPRKPNMSYGYCKKFDLKEISFIPGTCQIETQECFVHRKSITQP